MLYIMRHGKTDWNVRYKLQGRTDIPLNEEGREMARRAGKENRNLHFDVCYCSPLSRAKETAELFFEGTKVPVIPDDRLIEMSFGIYEGVEKCYQKPDCKVKDLFLAPEKYETVEGGESFEELFNRTGDFLEKVAKPLVKEGKNVLIVGHGVMNLSIINRIRGIELKDFWSTGIENCKLIRLI